MAAMSDTFPLRAILIGHAQPFRGGEASAIAKQSVSGPVAVTFLGLAGDEQADTKHHGGRDKALHHYPYDHYPYWREMLGDHPDLVHAGGFGENISTLGLTEADVWLGDRFRLGTALVEVSHGRQPCSKLGHRLGDGHVAGWVTKTGRCGWYYRVIEEGMVAPGDHLRREGRGLADWPIARLFHLLLGGGHKTDRADRADRAGLAALADMAVLAQDWRARARELLGQSPV